jgi:uncharacterized membrane protein YbaN (DUF454 family)
MIQPIPIRERMRRLPWVCLTIGSLGMGLAGAVLPLLPTTPFILLAAWAAPKGSPGIERWLKRHPYFGPLLTAWKEHRAIPTSAKVMAIGLMSFSWTMLYVVDYSSRILTAVGILFIGVTIFLLSRPAPHV